MAGEQKIGDYTIERRIAFGGMAEVLLCRIEGPGGFRKQVVLKRILETKQRDERYVKLFLDEARVAALFRHPNLVHVQALEQDGDGYFMVMEYLEGLDVDHLLSACERKNQLVPFDIAAHIVTEAAEGLHYAHQLRAPNGAPLNLIHRDISPANIIVTSIGSIKVVDFGIAKHAAQTHETQAGELKGKLSYMSPEQARGMDLDHRSDVFSLGAVLYELLTGVHCFKRNSQIETLAAVAEGEYVPASDYRDGVPPDLERILDRMLSPGPEDRHPTAQDVADQLRAFMAATRTPRPADVVDLLRQLTDGKLPAHRRCFTATGLLSADEVETASHGPGFSWGEPSAGSDEPTQISAVGQVVQVDAAPTGRLPIASAPSEVESTRIAREPVREVSSELEPSPPPPTVELVKLVPEAGTDETFLVDRTNPLTEEQASAGGGAGVGPGSGGPTPVRLLVLGGGAAVVLLALLGLWLGWRAGWLESGGEPALVVASVDAAGIRTVDAVTSVPALLDAAPARPDAAGIRVDAGRDPGDVAASAASDVVSPRPRPRSSYGELSIDSEPATKVLVDGRKVGTTPLRRHRLRAGAHTVVLVDKQLGLRRSLRVSVVGGRKVERSVRFERGQLVLEVLPWAEVHLRGKRLGVTPLPPIQLYEGTHTLLLKNPERGVERRVTVKIRAGKTTKALFKL